MWTELKLNGRLAEHADGCSCEGLRAGWPSVSILRERPAQRAEAKRSRLAHLLRQVQPLWCHWNIKLLDLPFLRGIYTKNSEGLLYLQLQTRTPDWCPASWTEQLVVFKALHPPDGHCRTNQPLIACNHLLIHMYSHPVWMVAIEID